MLMMLLEKKGIKCRMAVDGVEAVDVVLEKKVDFDFIFMDNMYEPIYWLDYFIIKSNDYFSVS